MAQADDVIVSLTNDPELSGDYNVFMNIRAAAEKIRKSAARFSVSEDKPLVLRKSRYNSKDMAALERLLAGGDFEKTEQCGDITLCAAASVSDEAEFAALRAHPDFPFKSAESPEQMPVPEPIRISPQAAEMTM